MKREMADRCARCRRRNGEGAVAGGSWLEKDKKVRKAESGNAARAVVAGSVGRRRW